MRVSGRIWRHDLICGLQLPWGWFSNTDKAAKVGVALTRPTCDLNAFDPNTIEERANSAALARLSFEITQSQVLPAFNRALQRTQYGCRSERRYSDQFALGLEDIDTDLSGAPTTRIGALTRDRRQKALIRDPLVGEANAAGRRHALGIRGRTRPRQPHGAVRPLHGIDGQRGKIAI